MLISCNTNQEATVVMNLTVMLVLVTMFISVSENLPKTSYIKMIDVWLVFVLIVPFLEVLVIVLSLSLYILCLS